MARLTLEESFRIALQHHQSGRLLQAEQMYRQILAGRPNHAEALHLLGVVAAQQGQHEDAASLIARAISIRPNWPEAHNSLGNALKAAGRFDEAIASYRQAIALAPSYAEAHYNIGITQWERGRLSEAIAAYRQAIALQPGFAIAHYNLGVALHAGKDFDGAISAYRQAIALNAAWPEVHNNLGNVLRERGRLEEALAAYRQAIAVEPRFAKAHHNLGNVWRDKGNMDEAVAAFGRAIALQPNDHQAHSNLGSAFKAKGELDAAMAHFRLAIALKPDFVEAHSNLVYLIHFHPGYDPRTIAEEHARWSRQHAEPLAKSSQPHANDRSAERRLRIGYVSPDFCEHPVGRFLLPLLAHYDKSQFEIFAYADVAVPDEMTQRLRSHIDVWRNILGLSDTQAAELIRQDRIDILVDLTMHMRNNRLLVFARKPAPVQATYLAYCSTTGLKTIDYRLSDPFLDPAIEEDSYYSERTIRLPQSYWCYQPCVHAPQVGPSPVLKNGWITFGCLNNFCKVSESAVAAWARILRNVPDSRLLLHAHEGNHRRRVQDRLLREGIESSRIFFSGVLPVEQYLEQYNRIDIGLDTFPYGGGTTTCDALWMGVPVVSLVGKTAVGRGGSSILSNLALTELAAQSEEEYVRLATELAIDPPRLGSLRSTLRQRMEQSPLMNADRFARDVEAAFRQMWQTWCASAPASV